MDVVVLEKERKEARGGTEQFINQPGWSKRGKQIQCHATAVAEDQLKTEGRRDLPPIGNRRLCFRLDRSGRSLRNGALCVFVKCAL